MSVLVVAPLLLVWSSWPPRHWPRDPIGEGLALLAGLGVALWLILPVSVEALDRVLDDVTVRREHV